MFQQARPKGPATRTGKTASPMSSIAAAVLVTLFLGTFLLNGSPSNTAFPAPSAARSRHFIPTFVSVADAYEDQHFPSNTSTLTKTDTGSDGELSSTPSPTWSDTEKTDSKSHSLSEEPSMSFTVSATPSDSLSLSETASVSKTVSVTGSEGEQTLSLTETPPHTNTPSLTPSDDSMSLSETHTKTATLSHTDTPSGTFSHTQTPTVSVSSTATPSTSKSYSLTSSGSLSQTKTPSTSGSDTVTGSGTISVSTSSSPTYSGGSFSTSSTETLTFTPSDRTRSDESMTLSDTTSLTQTNTGVTDSGNTVTKTGETVTQNTGTYHQNTRTGSMETNSFLGRTGTATMHTGTQTYQRTVTNTLPSLSSTPRTESDSGPSLSMSDTKSPSEETSMSMTPSRSLSGSLSLSEEWSLSATKSFSASGHSVSGSKSPRTPSGLLTPSLTLSRSASLEKTTTPSVTATYSPSITESPTDSGTNTATATRSQSDSKLTTSVSQSLSVSAAPEITKSHSFTRTVTPGETASRAHTLSPSITLTQSGASSSKSPSAKTPTPSEIRTSTPTHASPSESFTISSSVTDTISETLYPTGSQTDTNSYTDSLSVTFSESHSDGNQGSHSKSLSDGEMTDSLSDGPLSRTLSDLTPTITLSTTNSDGELTESYTTSIGSESNTDSGTFSLSGTESIGSITPRLSRSISKHVSISTSLTLSDESVSYSVSGLSGTTSITASQSLSSSGSVSHSYTLSRQSLSLSRTQQTISRSGGRNGGSKSRSGSRSLKSKTETYTRTPSDTLSGTPRSTSLSQTWPTRSVPITKSKLILSGSHSPSPTKSVSSTASMHTYSITYPTETVTASASLSLSSTTSISPSPSVTESDRSLSLSEERSMSFTPSVSKVSGSDARMPTLSLSGSFSLSLSSSWTPSITVSMSISDSETATVTETGMTPSPSNTLTFSDSRSLSETYNTFSTTYSLSDSIFPTLSTTASDRKTQSVTHSVERSGTWSLSESFTFFSPSLSTSFSMSEEPTLSSSESFTETGTLGTLSVTGESVSWTNSPTESEESLTLSASFTPSFTLSVTPSPTLTPTHSVTVSALTPSFTPSVSGSGIGRSLTLIPSGSITVSIGSHTPSRTLTYTASRSRSASTSVTGRTPGHTKSVSLSYPTGTNTRSGSRSKSYPTRSLSHPTPSHSVSRSSTLTITTSVSESASTSLTYSQSLTPSNTTELTTTESLVLTESPTYSISYTGSPREPSHTYSGSADITLTPSLSLTKSPRTITWSWPTNSWTMSPRTLTKTQPTNSWTNPTPSVTASPQTLTNTEPTDSRTNPTGTNTIMPSGSNTFSQLTKSRTGRTLTTTPTATLLPTDTQTIPTRTGRTLTMTGVTVTFTGQTNTFHPTPTATKLATLSTTITPPPTLTKPYSSTNTGLTPTPGSWTRTGKSVTFSRSVKATDTIELTDSVSFSLTESAVLTRSLEITESDTVSLSSTKSFSSEISMTASQNSFSMSYTGSDSSTLSVTITPPDTPTPTLTLSQTVTMSDDSFSLTETDGSFSLSSSATRTFTVSAATESLSFGSDTLTFTAGSETISESLTLTDTIQVFRVESNYITDPRNTFDVLPVFRTSAFGFTYSPPYAAGDRAGLVPAGTPCTELDPLNHVIAHSQLIEMKHTRVLVPSNWSVTITSNGGYSVCAYQAIVDKWTMLQPQRVVWFGPSISAGDVPIEPRGGGPCGPYTVRLTIRGGSAGDVLRLIPKGDSCASASASIYLSVTKVDGDFITVGGNVPIAGQYDMCYKGYPHQYSFTQYVDTGFNFYGSAAAIHVLSPNPTMPDAWINVTVLGHGLAAKDHYFISSTTDCTHKVSTGIPAINRRPYAGKQEMTVAFWAPKAGDMTVCYRSNSSTQIQPILGTSISVKKVVATAVTPREVSYAAGTRVSLVFQGAQLEEYSDVAELHWVDPQDSARSAFSCTTVATSPPTPLTYNPVNGAFEGIVSTARLGVYTICYGTATSYPVMVDNATIGVHQYFYDPEFEGTSAALWQGFNVTSNFAWRVSGYGLNLPSMKPFVVSAADSCPVTPLTQVTTALPITIANSSDLEVKAETPGFYRLCLNASVGSSYLMLESETFSVLPWGPTFTSPTTGDAGVQVKISGLGAVLFDATNGDRVGLCSAAAGNGLQISEYFPVLTGLKFMFTPLYVGTFEFCLEYAVRIHDNTTTITRKMGSFSSIPALGTLGASLSPVLRYVGEALALTAESYGYTTKDEVYFCDPTNSSIKLTSTMALGTSIVPIDATNWTVTVGDAGLFSLCHNSVSNSKSVTLVKNFAVHPKVLEWTPSTWYANQTTAVNYTATAGKHVISSIFMGPGCGTHPSPVQVDFNLHPVSTDSAWKATAVGLRGNAFSVCYTTILAGPNFWFNASSTVSVIPWVSTMALVDPAATVYSNCPTTIQVTGAALLSIDAFFLATDRKCTAFVDYLHLDAGLVAATQNQTMPGLFSQWTFTVLPAQPTVKYFMCYGRSITLAHSFGEFGASSSFSYTSPTKSSTKTSDFGFLCTSFAPAGSTYQYFVSFALGSGSRGIPLEEPNTNGTLSMTHMPTGKTYVLYLEITAPNGTVILGLERALMEDGGASFCTALPSPTTTGTITRQFAESYFILHNYGTLLCGTVTGASEPTPVLTHVRGLIKANATLLVDPTTMLPTLTDVVSQTSDPVSEATLLLDATLPALKPNTPVPVATIRAHIRAVRELLLIADTLKKTAKPQSLKTLVQNVLGRLDLITSVACASGNGNGLTANEGVFNIQIRRINPYAQAGQLSVGTTLKATIAMSVGSAAGYCISSVMMPTNLLPNPQSQPGVIRRRQQQLQLPPPAPTPSEVAARRQASTPVPTTTTDTAPVVQTNADLPKHFNLPLFSLNADPAKVLSPQPKITLAQFTFTYGAKLAPPEPNHGVDLIVDVYVWDGESWVLDKTAKTAHFPQDGTIELNVTSATNNQILVSGVMGWRLHDKQVTLAGVDLILIITTLCLGFVFAVAIVIARIFDHRATAQQQQSLDLQQAQAAGLDLTIMSNHRYYAIFANSDKRPQHPTTSPMRVSAAFSYIFSLFVMEVLLAASAERPDGSDIFGLLSGLVAASLAQPLGTIARCLFAQQAKDYPSMAGAVFAMAVGFPVAFANSFYVGAIATVGTGSIAWAIVAAVTHKKHWSILGFKERHPLVTALAWIWLFLCVAGGVALGLYYGIIGAIPQTPGRDTYQVVSSLLFGICIDAGILETVKWLVFTLSVKHIPQIAGLDPASAHGDGRPPSHLRQLPGDEAFVRQPDGTLLHEVETPRSGDNDFIHAPRKLNHRTGGASPPTAGPPRMMGYREEDDFDDIATATQGGGDSLYGVDMQGGDDGTDWNDALTVYTQATAKSQGGHSTHHRSVSQAGSDDFLYASPESQGQYSYGGSSRRHRGALPEARARHQRPQPRVANRDFADDDYDEDDNLSEVAGSESTGFYEVAPSTAFESVHPSQPGGTRTGDGSSTQRGENLSEVDSTAFESHYDDGNSEGESSGGEFSTTEVEDEERSERSSSSAASSQPQSHHSSEAGGGMQYLGY